MPPDPPRFASVALRPRSSGASRLQFWVLRTLKNISVLGTILKLLSVLAVQITGTHDLRPSAHIGLWIFYLRYLCFPEGSLVCQLLILNTCTWCSPA